MSSVSVPTFITLNILLVSMTVVLYLSTISSFHESNYVKLLILSIIALITIINKNMGVLFVFILIALMSGQRKEGMGCRVSKSTNPKDKHNKSDESNDTSAAEDDKNSEFEKCTKECEKNPDLSSCSDRCSISENMRKPVDSKETISFFHNETIVEPSAYSSQNQFTPSSISSGEH